METIHNIQINTVEYENAERRRGKGSAVQCKSSAVQCMCDLHFSEMTRIIFNLFILHISNFSAVLFFSVLCQSTLIHLKPVFH